MNVRMGLGGTLMVAAAMAIPSIGLAQSPSASAPVAPSPSASAPMTTGDAELAYCQSLPEFAASVQALDAIDESSTVDEFNAAVDRVVAARSGVGQSLRGLAEAQIAAVETAVGDLRAYRESLSGETIEQALEGAEAAIAAVGSARDDVGRFPDCEEVISQQGASPSP